MDKRNISRKLAAVTLVAVTAAARTGTAALAESFTGTGTVRKAAVFIRDGEEDTGSEYEAGAYAESITAKKGALEISDLMMNSGSYSFTGIAASGSASTVRMENSTINMAVDEETSGDQAGGDAVTAEDGASVFISDSDLTVEGAGRNVTFVGNNSRLIVNDSTFTSTGSSGNTEDIPEPDSNEALLISGSARANVSAGNSQTYYYNSTVTAEGWGALCTDPAKEGGSDLYAYNTQAYALDGGYGAGADANCRVWLYGSTINSAEDGVLISGNGQITAASGEKAPEEALAFNEGDTTAKETTITAGRNAVLFYASAGTEEGADDSASGTLKLSGGSVMTTEDALTSATDYKDKYGSAAASYLSYVSGADILIQGTGADISLDRTKLDSYSGVLVLSAIHPDSPENSPEEEGADRADPVLVKMSDMDVKGDILHMDYQRSMKVELNDTHWEGTLVSGTYEDWQEQWADLADEDTDRFPGDRQDGPDGAALTLNGHSKWTVNGDSVLASLSIGDDAAVIVNKGVRLTLTDGTALADGSQNEAVELHASDIK